MHLTFANINFKKKNDNYDNKPMEFNHYIFYLIVFFII